MYDLADVVPLAVTVRDSTGALANATAVTCTVTLPDGSTSSPSVTNTTTGTYTASYSPSSYGRHYVRWVATGSNASSYADVFDVHPASPQFIISLADAKDAANISSSVTDHDEEIRLYNAAATLVIEHLAGPQLSRTITETHDGGAEAIVLRRSPIAAVSSVTVRGLATTSYIADTAAGIIYAGTYGGATWTQGRQNVAVTYTVGTGVVPANVILAARELVRHWYQRGQQSSRPAFGGVGDADVQYVAGYAVPNFVVGILGPTRSVGGFA